MKKKTAHRKTHAVAKKAVHKSSVHPLHREVKLDASVAVTAVLVGFAVLVAVAMNLK